MFYSLNFSFFITKKVLLFFFFLVSINFHSFSIDSALFPKKLSAGASISIVSITYPHFSRAPFSKSCLRFYDAENNFDQMIDYVYFDNFDDSFFPLKFYLKNQKAKIVSRPAFESILYEKEKFNALINEYTLNLNFQELDYIYQFVRTLRSAMPDYEYEFDIINNNSETHIAKILNDNRRMNNNTNKRSLFNSAKLIQTKETLIKGNLLTICDQQFYNNEINYFPQNTKFSLSSITNDSLLSYFLRFILFIALLSLSLTTYQSLVYIRILPSSLSIRHSSQVFDFLILFCSGLLGFIIFHRSCFSSQSLLRHNLYFLCLFPLHSISAFFLFFPPKKEIFHKILWIHYLTSSALSILYLLISSIIRLDFILAEIILALPVLIRTSFWSIRDSLKIYKNHRINIKKEVKKD